MNIKSSLAILPKKINYLQRRSQEKLSHAIEDLSRSISYNSDTQPIVNQIELRVMGLRRSGNHAIINWIAKQIEGQAVFINHVRPLENPFRNQYESQFKYGQDLLRRDWKFRDVNWWKQEKEGKFSFKNGLIYSYEDQELEKIAHPSFERKHDMYLGKSAARFDVIVMRDPYNLIASRLQAKPRNFSMLEVYSQRYSLPKLWISYAKECLGETNMLKNNKLFINYNKWFQNLSYRQEIANQLNLTFSDDGLNDISESGRGSSFDGEIYTGKASKMDVMNRWKSYTDNSLYRNLLQTDDLQAYSAKLFGHIPGTEIFSK